MPKFLCHEEIADGKLVKLLPEWTGVKLPVSIVSPMATASSSRLNLVATEIATALRSALES